MPTATDLPEWDVFRQLPAAERAPFLEDDGGRLQMLIDAGQFTRPRLDQLFRTAEAIRSRWPDPDYARGIRRLLDTRSAALYFTQPSTRTYVSFALAARSVGLMCDEIRSAEMSSLYKGESELDTLLTLACLADAIIMRQKDHELMVRLAWEIRRRGLPTRILNGGSGPHEHPTQALLELYTLVSHFDLANDETPFTLGIVGDLRRSRTARSLAAVLALYPQVRQVFIAPDELQMAEDITADLDAAGVAWARSDDLDACLGDLDAVYMMRMQDEYGETSETLRQEYGRYRLTPDRASRLRPGACILHPLPRRDELPLEVDLDPRARYWEAVERGKWARVALLLHMFGKDADPAIDG
ncbi:MAG: aspartate/ornithine carbamoyltransferase family protein [Planctomycetota bacterium]|jgi:aspartate carbamoyltransferase catalytic subunit